MLFNVKVIIDGAVLIEDSFRAASKKQAHFEFAKENLLPLVQYGDFNASDLNEIKVVIEEVAEYYYLVLDYESGEYFYVVAENRTRCFERICTEMDCDYMECQIIDVMTEEEALTMNDFDVY